jgi:hypothetical protein
MIVSAWNNGKHRSSGAGYGVKIREEDRERYFKKDWKTVFIGFENGSDEAEINIDKFSFWSKTCGELISKKIGKWLIMNRLAPWDKGKPPKLNLVSIQENHFQLRK